MPFKTNGLDRILESVVNPPGTGAVSLGTAVPGYRTFASCIYLSNNDTCAYFIEAVDSNGNPTGLWERGFGTYTTTPAFARNMVIDGSGGAGSPVNFTTAIRIGIAPMTETVSPLLPPGGRLTGSVTTPVVDTATTGVSQINYMPYIHDRISLWDGYGLRVIQFGSIGYNIAGLAVGAYDIFGYISAYDNLSLTSVLWTNTTATGRATPLAYANGFLCLSTDPTKRYLGSIYLPAVGTTYDYANGGATSAGGKRFIWNMYNRINKASYVFDGTASWTYAVATWRIIRGVVAPLNCVEMFRGLNEDAVVANSALSGTCPAGAGFWSGISLNGGAPNSLQGGLGMFDNGSTVGPQVGSLSATFAYPVPIGYSTLALMEEANAPGTVTFGAQYALPGLNATAPS